MVSLERVDLLMRKTVEVSHVFLSCIPHDYRCQLCNGVACAGGDHTGYSSETTLYHEVGNGVLFLVRGLGQKGDHTRPKIIRQTVSEWTAPPQVTKKNL